MIYMRFCGEVPQNLINTSQNNTDPNPSDTEVIILIKIINYTWINIKLNLNYEFKKSSWF